MPLHRPRAALLTLTMVLIAGLILLPGTALAARPVQGSAAYVVLLRPPEGPGLPTRKGGLRAGATAIGRDRARATDRSIDALERQVGFSADLRYAYAVSGFAARLDAVQLAALRADRRVLGIRRDRPVEPAGQVTPTSVTRLRANPGGAPASVADVRVAVVDTGIGFWDGDDEQWRHAGELNVVGGVDAFSSGGGPCHLRAPDPTQNPGAYDDTNGHGTHVAGTIGAVDNNVGAVGVAPGAQLLSVRVFQGVSGSDATVICGLDWIAAWNTNHPSEALDIDVVNMSLRGYSPANPKAGCETPGNQDVEELAVCAVVETGATVVVAAGNETAPVSNYIPSRYESVITVSAMSDFDGQPGGLGSESCVPPRGSEVDDAFSRYSNYGPEVDVTAPGTCVLSTALASGGGTTRMSGTSMATPHVAGAIARYLAEHPVTTPAEMRHRLIATASLDWDAATDTGDSDPDRLVDVAALLDPDPDLRVFTVPQQVSVPAGGSEVVVKVRLQRIGGYSGAVTLDTGALPAGVASAEFSNADPIPGGGLGRSLTLSLEQGAPDGVRQLVVRAEGAGGGPTDQVPLILRFDATPPEIAGAWPEVRFRTGAWPGSAPVRLAWTASDAQGPLRRQELLRSVGSGSFSVLSRPAIGATSADTTIDRWKAFAWRIRAEDLAGNVAQSSPLETRLRPKQSGAAAQSSGWNKRSRRSAANKDLIVTRTVGASATFTFTGRAVAIVAPVGARKGRFRVRIDGAAEGTVSQASKTARARRIVFASEALTPGPHTLKVVARSGKVELDAFLVLD